MKVLSLDSILEAEYLDTRFDNEFIIPVQKDLNNFNRFVCWCLG